MLNSLKPRIAVLMEFPTALGGERSLIAVAEQLRTEFEFLFLAPPHGSLAAELEQGDWIHIPFSIRDRQGQRRADDDLLAELRPLLQQEQSDLLHANSVTLGRFIGRYRDQFPCPVTGHLRDIMKFSQQAIQDLAQLDRLIAVSQATADSYFEQSLPSSRVQIIHNGIDVKSFRKTPRAPLHRELQLPEGSQFAITIGQIGLRKGHDILFQALQETAPQFPNWHFLILGERYSRKAESIEFVRKLEQTLQERNIEQQVHWLGYLNEVPAILAQCDLLIHPARQEPFGRVLLEAAASKVAILATAVGGTPEMLQHAESAWLVPPNEVGGLANGCQKLMSDKHLRNQLAENAFQSISRRFSLETAAAAHAQLWATLLQNVSR